MHTEHHTVKLTFLGTGTSQGVPVIACPCPICHSADIKDKRLRSSVLIETRGKALVIDSGPDFRQQMLRANVLKLDGILFTHAHKDHTGGLDDVRSYNYLQKCDMDVYAETRVQDALKMEFAYIFAEKKYPGVPNVALHTISDVPFGAHSVPVIPIRGYHYKLPVLGFRIGPITYITDANRIDEPELEKIRGSKILVINALRKEKHLSHFHLDAALEVIQKTAPQQAYLTHISHALGLHQTVNTQLPPNVQLAYDGLCVEA